MIEANFFCTGLFTAVQRYAQVTSKWLFIDAKTYEKLI